MAVRHWDLGATERLKITAITTGVDNNNWRLARDDGQAWVITLVRVISTERLQWVTALLQALQASGLSCPAHIAPLTSVADPSTGPFWGTQRLVLAPWLQGEALDRAKITERHCHTLGRWLATLHTAMPQVFQEAQAGALPPPPEGAANAPPYGTMSMLLEAHAGQVSAAERSRLSQAADAAARLAANPHLSRGIIHADLFVDNLLLADHISNPEQATPVYLDFYASRPDALILDIAFCAYDWCWKEGGAETGAGGYAPQFWQALVAGYAEVRALSAAELEALADALQVVAAEVWLRRLARKLDGSKELPPQRLPAEAMLRWHSLDVHLATPVSPALATS